MRLAALAVPFRTSDGGTKLNLTPYPFDFTLSEFMMLWHRVRTWQLAGTIYVQKWNGTSYDAEVSQEVALTLNRRAYVGDPGVLYESESDRIHDQESHSPGLLWATPDGTEAAYFRIGNSDGDFPNFWTGTDAGEQGRVMPRFELNYSLSGAYVDDVLIFGLACNTAHEVDDHGEGDLERIVDGLTYDGQAAQFHSREHPDYRINALDVALVPFEYFTFSNADADCYNSVTGEVVLDPLTASIP